MACDFSEDHELRDKVVTRFMHEVIGVDYFELAEVNERLRSIRYRELARPLILNDYRGGTDTGMLCIRFGMTTDQIYRLIKNYYDENCCS